MHVDEERKRPGSRRQVEVARKRNAVMGGVDDVLAEFGAGFVSRLIDVGQVGSSAWLDSAAEIPAA
jgi:hypothetical protein